MKLFSQSIRENLVCKAISRTAKNRQKKKKKEKKKRKRRKIEEEQEEEEEEGKMRTTRSLTETILITLIKFEVITVT